MTQPTCSALVPTPTLYGTPGDDRFHVAKADGADGLKGLYKVELNGQTLLMDEQELENTRFELGAGNDTVTVDAGVKPHIHVNGGTGTTHLLGDSGKVVQVGDKDVTALPQPFRIPGTPLIVTPLEPARAGESLRLFGHELPFRSARISNDSCITAIPQTQPGQPAPSVPRGSITVHADRASVDITDRVRTSLHPDVAPGTPLNGKGDEANVRRHELIDPSLAVGKRLVGTGTLSLRDPYPAGYVSPTELSITATSENFKTIVPKLKGDLLDFGQVGRIRANAFGVGGAKLDVSASLDLTRIDKALAPLHMKDGEAKVLRQELVQVVKAKLDELAKNPAGIDTLASLRPGGEFEKSLKQAIDKHVPPQTPQRVVDGVTRDVLAEMTHPGVSAQGPMFLGLPVGYGYFSAETTRHLRAPLEGSGIGLPFPATLATVGPTLIPAGVIKDYATPAGGATLARDWQSAALSPTIAVKPSLEPGSIGAEGVAAVRGGVRLGGWDLAFEAGWRGRAALGAGGGGAKGHQEDPVTRDFKAIHGARREAELRFMEDSEKSEAGVFRSDLLPAEVLGTDRSTSEWFLGGRAKKHF